MFKRHIDLCNFDIPRCGFWSLCHRNSFYIVAFHFKFKLCIFNPFISEICNDFICFPFVTHSHLYNRRVKSCKYSKVNSKWFFETWFEHKLTERQSAILDLFRQHHLFSNLDLTIHGTPFGNLFIDPNHKTRYGLVEACRAMKRLLKNQHYCRETSMKVT